MKIIGHRGAAGLELENTLSSLQKAKELGCDGVEFDVRITKDRRLVLCHDADLARVSHSGAKIADHTLKQLRQVTLHNGDTVPTLEEALRLLGGTLAMIEPKDDGCAVELLAAIDKFPDANIIVTTFEHKLGTELENQRPDLIVYLAEHFKPTEILRFIRHAKANGLTLNAWLLNPYTYWLIRHRGLNLMVYGVNSRFIGWFIRLLYPAVLLCTDHPERFIKNRRLNPN